MYANAQSSRCVRRGPWSVTPAGRKVAGAIAILACAGLVAAGCRRTTRMVVGELQAPAANSETPQFLKASAAADRSLRGESSGLFALRNADPAEPAPPAEGVMGREATIGALALIGKGTSATVPYSTRHAKAAASGHSGAPPRAPALAFAEDRPAPAPAAPRLDPNARYATTYRPGAAALGALDAALARGTIPPVYRDLVGDFGARYAPAFPAPDKGALAVRVDAERAVIAPAGGPLHLRVALRSAAGRQLRRARLSVAVALDVSGSMRGAAIENARAAAAALVRRLDDGDRFALVTFSGDAQVLVAAGPVGPRRARILAQIATIAAVGGTNISAGLEQAYGQAMAYAAHADVLPIVMLLSDGQATAGDTDPASLAGLSARAFQHGVQTSAFGLGDNFDAPLLSAIADRGAGGYYYLATPEEITPAFARELDARLVPAALAVELRVRLRPDVAALKVYGSRRLDEQEAAQVRAQEIGSDEQAQRRDRIARDRHSDAAGGMRFFLPSFARDDHYALLLSLQLPAGVSPRAIASVEVRYKDRLLGKNVTEELPVRVRYGASEAASAATIDAGVLRTVQAFAAGDAILRAAGQVDAGDRAGAARLLGERAQLLADAARRLGEPRFSEDSQRLARLAEAVGGVQDQMALAVLLRGSGSGFLR